MSIVATDEELKIWQERPCGDTQCRCTELHLDKAIARIESDQATIADLLSALKQFVNGLDTCNCPVPQPLVCRFCMGRVAIAKAETREEA